jgi:hypothetical protein
MNHLSNGKTGNGGHNATKVTDKPLRGGVRVRSSVRAGATGHYNVELVNAIVR